MSDQYIKGSVRRSQLITTYGIGSIIALGDESFMVAGIDHWPPRLPDVLNNIRIHSNNGEMHFHDDTANLKVAVPVADAFAGWSQAQDSVESFVPIPYSRNFSTGKAL